MRIDSSVVEPFDFAAFGARQPTSRARVLEVRIQVPSSREMLWGGRRDFLPRSQEVKRRDGNPNAIVCPLRRERWIRQLMAHLA